MNRQETEAYLKKAVHEAMHKHVKEVKASLLQDQAMETMEAAMRDLHVELETLKKQVVTAVNALHEHQQSREESPVKPPTKDKTVSSVCSPVLFLCMMDFVMFTCFVLFLHAIGWTFSCMMDLTLTSALLHCMYVDLFVITPGGGGNTNR
jgi:CRISPR/Cas system-associated exonuclease Cas4 (RecB family)